MLKGNINITERKHFVNINGKEIICKLTRNDSSMQVTVKTVPEDNLHKKSAILLVIVVINIISLIFEFFSQSTCAVIFVFSSLYMYYMISQVKQESLLIVQSLGYQVSIKYLLGSKTIFIPSKMVQDVFINEVIWRLRIIYVLSILTKDVSNTYKIIPLFKATQPNLKCLEYIYQNLMYQVS